MKTYKDEGIVLQRKNYSEGDRILTVFTKKNGKVSLLARGIRKPRSRKRGHLEIFSRISFSASKTKGMDIITEVDTLDSYSEIRDNLNKVSLAYFLVEVVARITSENERQESLYSLLTTAFGKLKDVARLKSFKNIYTKKVLEVTGFWPKGKPLSDPEKALEEVIERKLGSVRIGKKIVR